MSGDVAQGHSLAIRSPSSAIRYEVARHPTRTGVWWIVGIDSEGHSFPLVTWRFRRETAIKRRASRQAANAPLHTGSISFVCVAAPDGWRLECYSGVDRFVALRRFYRESTAKGWARSLNVLTERPFLLQAFRKLSR
jgi:hypothetical protein